ncbi:hypothetical protein TNCV_767481 [Trichonephila clavipes]|nr:hypothetical protein TNCV_767481 [Trichonephila clavipes]
MLYGVFGMEIKRKILKKALSKLTIATKRTNYRKHCKMTHMSVRSSPAKVEATDVRKQMLLSHLATVALVVFSRPKFMGRPSQGRTSRAPAHYDVKLCSSLHNNLKANKYS